jgi:hypothetical protein
LKNVRMVGHPESLQKYAWIACVGAAVPSTFCLPPAELQRFVKSAFRNVIELYALLVPDSL